MRVTHFSAHCGSPAPGELVPALFRISDVVRITTLSKATVYRRIAEGKFPKPLHVGIRARRWTRTSISTWLSDPDGYGAMRQPARVEKGKGLREAADMSYAFSRGQTR